MLEKSLRATVIKLHQKKYRDELGLFLVEGEKGVQEAVAAGADIEHVFYLEGTTVPQGVDAIEIHESDADKMKTTETFPGIMALVRKHIPEPFTSGPIICLDRVNDPGNLGTIIRTADWFGITQILLSEESVDPYNPKVVRSTMGSLFRTTIHESDDIITDLENLRQKGYALVSLDMQGKPLRSLPKQQNTVYIFGSESHGIRPALAEISEAYTIPGNGQAESLNVAIAAGIIMNIYFTK